ncbi:MAG: cellulase family glycosylhydrolase [Thermoleophilaceae bacterium]|nr:cellulase family glycosylhydrolase [Thermoleophilaceae bacterium]
MSVRRLLILVFAAVSALLLMPAAGQAALEYGLQAERLGSQTLSEAEVHRMRQARVDFIRTPFEWEIAQGSGPDQEYDFTNFDRLMDWATEGDLPQIEILPTLIGTPSWVKGAKTNNYPPTTPQDLERWADFVTAIVDRYGKNGPIEAWQVWNEPNLNNFWDGTPNVREYAKFLDFTDKAIRRGDPSALTVLAGMPQRPDAPKPQAEYLEPLYKVKGVKNDFDVVATHPFANTKRQLIESVQLIRDLMDDAKDKNTPLWITETGFASAGPPHPFRRTPAGQAKILEQVLTDLRSKSRRLKLEKVVWFSWRDADTDPPIAESNNRWQTYSGLFTFGGEPKPAWPAFVELTGGDPGEGAVAIP